MNRLVLAVERLVANRTAVFGIAALTAVLWTRGRPQASFDTEFYAALSDAVMTSDFESIFAPIALRWTTLVFVVLVTMARTISQQHWLAIMMAVNIACSALTAVLLVAIVRRVTRCAAVAAVALVFYLACWDVMIWIQFVLTDTIYSLLALLAFGLVVSGVLGIEIRRRRLLLGLTLVVLLFTRAVAIVLIPLVLFAELVLTKPPERRPAWLRGKPLLLLCIVALLLVSYVRAALYQVPERWPFEFLRPKVIEHVTREKRGEVVWDRPETSHRPPVTMTDYVLLQTDRTARFFQFTSSKYSRAHNLVNVLFYVPLYALALIGVVYGGRSADWRRRAVVLAAATWVLVYAVFHGMTFLDFDWRYRLPLMPHLLILMALGVEALVTRRRLPEP